MSKQVLVLFLITLFLFPSSALAEDVLSLDDFVKTAIKNNPSYQISAKEYLIALQTNKNAKSIEDWNLIASGAAVGASAAPSGGFSPTYQQTLNYSLGLEKYIAHTGTAVIIEHNNARVSADYPSITIGGTDVSALFPSSYYASNLSLSISQPLLKNAFGLATRMSLQMSDYALDLADIKLAEDWEDFIASLHEDYLTWQKCQKNVNIYQDKVKKVKDQLKLVKQQKRYGLSEDVDLVQIEQKVKAYEILLEQARMACEAQTKKILRFSGQDLSLKVKPAKFTDNNKLPDETAALNYLATNSNLKTTAELLVAIQKANLEIKSNATLPEANLVLQAKPSAFTSGFSDSISKIGDYNEYTVSVNTSRPIANSQANAEAKQAEEEYSKSLKERDNILLNAAIGLSTLYTNLEHIDKIIELQGKNLKLAKQRLKLEQQKYRQGRSSVFFTLQAEDELLLAENAHNDSRFTRKSIVNQINSFTDRYLIKYNDLLRI
ncbi:TolC family protein [Candidatus Margulisiibacteriota bacterium]